ncbi:polysaccharide deacetylase family protein [Brackiella oedipodis]|uniref:polysaccharide deacetylase family protein n=1 Tax=Brackiella oedipodis TaxID=124225 RepID=UPI0004906173|nr:polysaccharide deacetylase family protein [Brackiella oedipodis]
MSQIVPVVMFHHVSPAGGMINTSPQHFESQLKALQHAGYHTLTGQQFAAFLAGQPVPEKSVLLTFDDGYLNNWVYAHPILQKYGMHALLFLITDLIGSGEARPHAGMANAVLPQAYDHKRSQQLIQDHQADKVMLRWSEVKAMQAAGTFEFHSHTHTHTRWDKQLPATEKNQKMQYELAQSRQSLLQHLGTCSNQLCWPQGYFDDDYVQIAQAHGFEILYTTQAFGFNKAYMDPRYIYRISDRDRPGSWLIKRLWLARQPLMGGLYHRFKAFKKSKRKALRQWLKRS